MELSIKNLLLITLVVAALNACHAPLDVVSGNHKNQNVSGELSAMDSSIVKLVAPFKQKLEGDMKRVIGFSTKEMVKNKPESPLTNFMADLLIDESMRICAEKGWKIEPDISFINYGGIRTFLPKGEITVGKIFEIMPFENELVLLQLKGTEIQKFMDLIASRNGESLGGASFGIQNNKAVKVKINDAELQPDKLYWLATSDYVADGGDSYSMLRNNVELRLTGSKIRDIMISYLDRTHKEGKIIDINNDGRIYNE